MDSAPYHLRAWQVLARERGTDLKEVDFLPTFGQRNLEILHTLFGPHLTSDEVVRLSQRKEELFRQLAAGHISPLPGAVPLVHSLARAGCPQAIVSSTSRENIALMLGALGIAHLFQAIVAGEDVAQGKPSPEGFLKAAQLLGVAPSRCLVIEDSVAGIRAARAAGMRCLAVATTHLRERLAEADSVVDRLEGLTAAELLG